MRAKDQAVKKTHPFSELNEISDCKHSVSVFLQTEVFTARVIAEVVVMGGSCCLHLFCFLAGGWLPVRNSAERTQHQVCHFSRVYNDKQLADCNMAQQTRCLGKSRCDFVILV